MASADDITIKFVVRRVVDGKKAPESGYEITFPAPVVPDPTDSLEIDIQYATAGQVIPQAKKPRVFSTSTSVSGEDGKMKSSGTLHTYVTFSQERFVGDLNLRVAWKHQGQSFERIDRRPANSQLNTKSTHPVTSDEPQLFRKIGKATGATLAKLPAEADAKDAARFGWRGFVVGRVVDHVHTQLGWGLGSYWHAYGGDRLHDGVPLCEVPTSEFGSLKLAQLEECWAQHVTEAMLISPYESAGNFMQPNPVSIPNADKGHMRDAAAVRKMRQYKDGDAAFYPIIYACQQLTTAAMFFRGHFEVADNPFDAVLWGTTGNVDGATRKKVAQPSVAGTYLDSKGWLRPGVVIYRATKADANKPIRHVGIVLRASRGTKKYQLLDVGGWFSSNFGGGGAFDSGFMKHNWRKLHSVLAPPTTEAQLRSGLKALRAAQLVISRRGSGDAAKRLYWASPMLHMHEGTGDARKAYPFARLMASLRDLPYAGELDVRWRIYVPQLANCDPAMDAVITWWRLPKGLTTPVVEIGVGTDGSVKVLQHVKHDLSNNTHVTVKLSLQNLRKDFDPAPKTDDAKLRAKYPEMADMKGVKLPDYFKGTP